MLKALRTRFILVAMLCVVGVMAAIVASINVTNYSDMVKSADQTIGIISQNGGEFPKEEHQEPEEHSQFPPQEKPQEVPPEKHEEHPSQREEGGKNKGLGEKPFAVRYFTVTLHESGEVTETNVTQVGSVSEETAKTMATTCYQNNKTKGFLEKFRFGQTQTTNGVTYIFVNCETELEGFFGFLWNSVGISAAGIALVFVLVWFFSGMVMKPIAESYEKQKRFITDAGHELKTPLTIIDANTEVLEMERGESPWIESIRNQVSRLNDLTQKLVFLSRMEEEEKPLSITEFSLTDAIIETASPFRAVAAAGGKTLEIACKEGVSFKGDEATIRQLVSLLLDNAMKYSVEKGTISLSLTENGKKKQLTVTNTVEKVGTTSPALWFDRFYRQESSRNSATGGHGIGLSVAQAIVNAHKGKISAAYQNGNQVVITVIL